MDYLERYEYWCRMDLPEDVRAELNSIKNNADELKSRFGGKSGKNSFNLKDLFAIGQIGLGNFCGKFRFQFFLIV